MRRELCAVRAAWATRMGEVRGTGVLPPSRRLRQAQVAGAVLWAHSPMFTDIHLYSLIFTEIHPIRAKNKKIARTARAITKEAGSPSMTSDIPTKTSRRVLAYGHPSPLRYGAAGLSEWAMWVMEHSYDQVRTNFLQVADLRAVGRLAKFWESRFVGPCWASLDPRIFKSTVSPRISTIARGGSSW